LWRKQEQPSTFINEEILVRNAGCDDGKPGIFTGSTGGWHKELISGSEV
jgi:hypothetical protein